MSKVSGPLEAFQEDQQGQRVAIEAGKLDRLFLTLLAADALRNKIIQLLGDRYFQRYRRGSSASEAIFTRKVGHTQRGGRPIRFDRFYAATGRLVAAHRECAQMGRTRRRR